MKTPLESLVALSNAAASMWSQARGLNPSECSPFATALAWLKSELDAAKLTLNANGIFEHTCATSEAEKAREQEYLAEAREHDVMNSAFAVTLERKNQ